ncbi:MAG: GNAT family N-acetyltransferase, partial [Lachnospiraceae bacterium]|nr:GNAT family N-acetyltransferase [Lachnospiraceae bacterium]
MNITCRQGRIEDLPRLLEIEASAIPGNRYLEGVKDLFFDNSHGELIVAETEGLPIGFARFTLQYDGAAWLEILRVHKDWQRKGCGRVIWNRFMELAKQYKVPAMRMYTGEKNVASRSLAEQNGLHVAWHTLEGTLPREACIGDVSLYTLSPCIGDVSLCTFSQVTDPAETAALLAPFAPDYHGYFCSNRTYYEMNDAVYAGVTKDFTVWKKDGSALVTGARFLKERGLNLCT